MNTESIIVYRDEDEYLAVHGGGSLIGTSIFCQTSRERNIDTTQAVLMDMLTRIEDKNRKLRYRMRRELRNGEIRFMTTVEKLRAAAEGHTDNEATAAAMRCLRKRGL